MRKHKNPSVTQPKGKKKKKKKKEEEEEEKEKMKKHGEKKCIQTERFNKKHKLMRTTTQMNLWQQDYQTHHDKNRYK